MENFDIYSFDTEAEIKQYMNQLSIPFKLKDKLPYFQKQALIFTRSESYTALLEVLGKNILESYLIVIGETLTDQHEVSFLLNEHFTETEFRLALNCGKKALTKRSKSTFIVEKNKLITEELSGNIHDIFSYLNNISARVQFLEMVIKDNSHVDNAVELTIDQTRKMTKILRNLQIFSKSDLNPDDKANIKVQDLFINLSTMFSNKLMKRKISLNIDSLTELEYFTGCNIDILFLFMASTLKLITEISDESTIYITAGYELDQLNVVFNFKAAHSIPTKLSYSDLYNDDIISKKLYQNLMESSKASLELHTETNETHIVLHFPKGV